MALHVVATKLSFLLLGASAVVSIRRAKDASTATFAAVAYLTLVLLLWSARALERLPPGADAARSRRRLKVAVSTLAAALNWLFSRRVSAILPPPLGAAVWAVSGTTSAAGFYVCFVHAG